MEINAIRIIVENLTPPLQPTVDWCLKVLVNRNGAIIHWLILVVMPVRIGFNISLNRIASRIGRRVGMEFNRRIFHLLVHVCFKATGSVEAAFHQRF